MIDLDHFKRVNDTYGHVAGDVVLKEAGQRIALAVRSYDFVGRFGGEEFLAVLSKCTPDDLQQVAERARGAVAELPILANGVEIRITASVGGVVTLSELSEPELDLLAAADAALYRAKQAGRNRVVVGSSRGSRAQNMAGETDQTSSCHP